MKEKGSEAAEYRRGGIIKDFFLRTFAIYAGTSFLWICLVQAWMTANNASGIAEYAKTLVVDHIAIALFSAVVSGSFILFEVKKLSAPAARFLHVVINLIAVDACVFVLFDNVRGTSLTERNGWLTFMLFVTMGYFVIYGVAALTVYFIKRKRK